MPTKGILYVGFYWVCAVFMLVVGGCAQIVNPTGGEKDVRAAVVLSTTPNNQSVRFSEKQITFVFDEFIQLTNPAQQIVFSPPLNEKPEYELQGKKLHLVLREQLRPNTTYSINFGNAITDVHEGNITSGFTYAFSTGEYIDSFRLQGICRQAFNLSTEKELLVGLYNQSRFTDSTLFTSKPDYFGITDASGNFSIQNLPDSVFHVFVFKDENKNLKYDRTELIGFDTVLYRVSDTAIKSLRLRYFTPDKFIPNQLVDTFTRYAGRASFVVYKHTGFHVKHALTDAGLTVFKPGKNDLDTFFVYTADTSLQALYTITTADTSYRISLKKTSAKPLYPLMAEWPRTVELGDTIWVRFSVPVVKADTARIVLKRDSVPVSFTYGFSAEKNMFYLVHIWNPETRYSLVVNDSAFTDMYGRYSTKTENTFTIKSIKDYAVLVLTVKHIPPDRAFIIQLWNDSETELLESYSVHTDITITHENIVPTKLKIKIIDDLNKNGKWDNGVLNTMYLPEFVYYIKEPVVLRAYWDSEQIIDMSDVLK